MTSMTENTPDLALDENPGPANGSRPEKKLRWHFQTGPEIPMEDIRTALSLLGADFNPDRDQLALSDQGSEVYGGMDSRLGPHAVDCLKKAVEDLEDFQDAVENWRTFQEMSPAERQDFMSYAVECYSFVADGNFMETDAGLLRDLANIVTGLKK